MRIPLQPFRGLFDQALLLPFASSESYRKDSRIDKYVGNLKGPAPVETLLEPYNAAEHDREDRRRDAERREHDESRVPGAAQRGGKNRVDRIGK